MLQEKKRRFKLSCCYRLNGDLTTSMWRSTMNIVAFLNPILSSKIPATLGPMKAPRANVLVHSPLIRPYVSRLFENPYCLKIINSQTIKDTHPHIYIYIYINWLTNVIITSTNSQTNFHIITVGTRKSTNFNQPDKATKFFLFLLLFNNLKSISKYNHRERTMSYY